MTDDLFNDSLLSINLLNPNAPVISLKNETKDHRSRTKLTKLVVRESPNIFYLSQ